MLEEYKRFDMRKKPKRQGLRPIAWLLSFPDVRKHKAQIVKNGMEGIKPPYLLLANHNAFLDFKVCTAAVFPHRANYVVAIDGFTTPTKKGFTSREWLMRAVGCICTRKFTNDVALVRQMQRVVKNKDIAVLYPEARYSLCGTTAVLPDSLGKLAKLLRVPVVSLICSGHHVNSPFWNLEDRGVKPTHAEMTLLLTAEQAAQKSVSEINEIIRKAFVYDDFKWQKDNGIHVDFPRRAEGLHKVLYQCPACRTQYKMNSRGTELFCEACGRRWEMTDLGELKAKAGQTEFSHIPDWYEWERANVRAEAAAGKYCFNSKVKVCALPNSDGYIDMGEGELTHNLEGFTLTGSFNGKPYELKKPVKSLYSCHIEYEYLGKYGDCIDLNTNTDTFYIYPQGEEFAVTKIALATEELYSLATTGQLPDPEKD